MDTNKFDINAQKLIDNHETPVNTEALWLNVQAELYPKKKKRFAWIWFSASSIAAIFLFSGYVYFSNSTERLADTKLATAPIEKQVPIATETIKQITTATNATAVQASADEDKVSSAGNIKTKQSKIQKDKIEKKTKISSPKQKSIKGLSILNEVKSEAVTTDRKSDDTAAPQMKEEDNTKTKTPAVSIEKEIIEESKINIDSPQINKETKAESTVLEESKVIAENTTGIQSEDIITTPEVVEPKIELAEENEQESIFSRKLKRAFQMGVGFRTGISNSLTTLSAISDEHAELRLLRSQSETNLETIDVALEFLLKHKTGFYLSTGLDYMKAARKLTFNSEVIVVDSIPGIANIYVNPITMDTTYVEGMIERTTTSFQNKEVYNNLHIVNIPITLGASIDHEQWTFSIQGGALLNVLLKQKGQIMDSESTFYDLKTDEANWFKDNLDVSFHGAGLIGYNFTDNFQLSGGPSFRSSLILSEELNPIKQSQIGLGLQINARYWFE